MNNHSDQDQFSKLSTNLPPTVSPNEWVRIACPLCSIHMNTVSACIGEQIKCKNCGCSFVANSKYLVTNSIHGQAETSNLGGQHQTSSSEASKYRVVFGYPVQKSVVYFFIAVIVLVWVVFVAVTLPSFIRSNFSPPLAEQVKASMEAKFNTDPAFSKFLLKVESVTTVKLEGNQHQGIARILYEGNAYDIPIQITYDGNNLLWQTQPGAFLFLAQKQMEKALQSFSQ